MNKSKKFQLLSTLIFWLLVVLTPSIIVHAVNSSTTMFAFLNSDTPYLLLGILQIPITVVSECCLLLLLGCAIRSFSNAQLRLVLSIALSVVLVIYSILLVVIWFAALRYNLTISLDDIFLLPTFFQNRTFAQYIYLSDRILAGLLVCLTFALLSFQLFKNRADYQIGAIFKVILFCVAVTTLLQLFLRVSTDRFVHTKIGESYLISKTIEGPLLAHLLFSAEIQNYQIIPLDLQTQTPYRPSSVPTKNVLILAIEALRYDVTVSEMHQLPNLATLMKSGISFPYAYAQASDTEYSLNTILSGTYPLKFPHRNTSNKTPPPKNLSNIFKSIGYRTGKFTVFDWASMAASKELQTWDYYSDPTLDGGAINIEQKLLETRKHRGINQPIDNQEVVARLDQANFNRFIDWVTAAQKERFFSLWYFYSSHFPYNVEQDEPYDRENSDRSYYFPPYRTFEYKERYISSLKQIDVIIGNLLKFLESSGLLENTLIIVTGDHGEEFYEHGGCLHVGQLHEEIVHVPLIIFGANRPCNSNLQTNVGHVDIAPTILGSLGMDPFPGFQGINVCGRSQPNRVLFSSSQALTEEDAVYYGPHKLVRNYRGLGIRRFNRLKDPREEFNLFDSKSDIDQKLLETLTTFRNSQISFYALPYDVINQHYPPKSPNIEHAED